MVKNVLRQPPSWIPRKVQCPRITSQMRPGKRFTLKAYSRPLLRRQNLMSVARTSMLHTIELITETCHDARMYFLLMGLEASFVKRFAVL